MLASRWRRQLVGRCLVGVTLVVATVSPAFGAASDRAAVIRHLSAIRTAAGMSVYDRMRACGLKINWAESWIDPIIMPTPSLHAGEGDWVIAVTFDAPPLPGSTAEEADNLKELSARWVIRGGKSVSLAGGGWALRGGAGIPENGWARVIQNNNVVGSQAWLNC